MNEIRHQKTLTLPEEQALAARIRSGDRRAVNDLVKANLKFVWSVCSNYRNQGLSMGDLLGEGNLGLLRAVQRYDSKRGFKFISYAVWWIRQAILDALAGQTRVLALPTGRVQALYKVNRARRKLEHVLGRSPSFEELAEATGEPAGKIQECLQLTASSLSLSKTSFDESGSPLEDSLPDENGASADQDAQEFLLAKSALDLLGTLDDRESHVIRLFYGIGMETTFNLSEIGQRYGLTRERIRQIKNLALRKLKHPSSSHRISLFRSRVKRTHDHSLNRYQL